MRATSQVVRRRNNSYLQARSLERQAARLARDKSQENAYDADSSGNEPVSSADSSDDEFEDKPTKTVRPSFTPAFSTFSTRTGVSAITITSLRPAVSAGVVLAPAQADAESDSDSDPDDDDDSDSEDESTTTTGSFLASATPATSGAHAPAITTSSALVSLSKPESTVPPTVIPTLRPSSGATTLRVSSARVSSVRVSSVQVSSVRVSSVQVSSVRVSSVQVSSVRVSSVQVSSVRVSSVRISSLARSSSIGVPVASTVQTVPTQRTTTPFTSVVSTTNAPSLTVPVTGAVQSGAAKNQSPEREMGEGGKADAIVAPTQQNKLSPGTAAGIAIGVLAFIAILVTAALLWRKRRRSRGLPFFSQKRLRLGDDNDEKSSDRSLSIGGPLPGRVRGHTRTKTNTQIMDDLMRAAFAVDSGGAEGATPAAEAQAVLPPAASTPKALASAASALAASAPTAAPASTESVAASTGTTAWPQTRSSFLEQQQQTPRPPTSGRFNPRLLKNKPLMKWLSEIKTPTQPRESWMPPTPQMSSTAMPGLPPRPGAPVAAMTSHPRRETMRTETTETTEATGTTGTTNTSVRWYG